jgi:hypothetical protein
MSTGCKFKDAMGGLGETCVSYSINALTDFFANLVSPLCQVRVVQYPGSVANFGLRQVIDFYMNVAPVWSIPLSPPVSLWRKSDKSPVGALLVARGLQNTDRLVSLANTSSARVPARELPSSSSSGDHTQIAYWPGMTAAMPPPTPDLAGMPTRNAKFPTPS